MDNDLFIKILLSVIGSVSIFGAKQLLNIAKSINEIKTQFEVLSTKHNYLEDRVKNLERKNV